jgi:hypothetical protein
MSQEVSLNGDDYRVVMSWFDRIFADGVKDPTTIDNKTYQKLCVMAWAFTDEMEMINGHKKDKDNDDLGR